MERQSLNQHLGLSHNQTKCGNISVLCGEPAPHGALQDHPCPPEAPGENLELTTAGTVLIMKDVQGHPGKPPLPNKPHPQTLTEPWSPELL